MTETAVLNLAELRRLLADSDACGEYLVPGDGPSRLEVAAVEALEPLLDLVDRMGRVLEAGYSARVPPVTNSPTCFFCGLLCLIQHKCVTIDMGDGRFIYFHNAHEEDCWAKEKETRAALDVYREAKESASQ